MESCNTPRVGSDLTHKYDLPEKNFSRTNALAYFGTRQRRKTGFITSLQLQVEMSTLVDEFIVDEKDVEPTFGKLYRSKDLILTDEDYFVNAESGEFEEFVGGETR